MAGLLQKTKQYISDKLSFKDNIPIDNGNGENQRKDDPSKMQNEIAYAYSISNILHGGFERMYNPDSLVKYKGARIYNKMLLDDQVQAAFNLKINIIISRKMRFKSTGSGQEEIIDFFERNTQDLFTGTWLGAMRGVLMGKAYGFSFSEKVFKSSKVDNKVRWALDKLKLRPYDSFIQDVDENANVKAIRQEDRLLARKSNPLDPNKFIKYVNKPEIDPIWGQSDLKAAYRPYWEKDITSKFWNIFLERMAGGFITVTPGERAANLVGKELTDLENILKNLSAMSGIKLPQGYEAQMHYGRETNAYKDRIEHADKQIARALIIPNLLGFSEQGHVGSYAQSKTQFEVFMMLVGEDGDYLADIFNEQLFAQLAYWNFGVTEYPRMIFDPYTTAQKHEIAKLWIEAKKNGVITQMTDDELHFRDFVQFPVPDKKDLDGEKEKRKKENEEKLKSAIQTSTTQQQIPNNNPNSSNDDSKKTNNIDNKPTGKQNQSEFSDESSDDEIKISFADRIDFKRANDELDSIENNFYKGLVKGVDSILLELETIIKAINKDLPKDKTKIDNKKIKTEINNSVSPKVKKELRKSILNSLKSTYNLGWNTAYRATEKAALQNDVPNKFLKLLKSIVTLSERKVCTDGNWSFINFVDGISLDVAERWFSDQAFTITGDITQDMIDEAIKIMSNGIVNDWSTKQMIDELTEVLGNLTGGTKKQNRARLETIVRTNMSTIFVQAQLAFYTDDSLNGFVEALQYSSVLDARTTPICERLSDSVYAINNSIWGFITPPNHFNCRSVLLPVTIFDKWKEDKKTFSENQLPGKGFGRSGLANFLGIELT